MLSIKISKLFRVLFVIRDRNRPYYGPVFSLSYMSYGAVLKVCMNSFVKVILFVKIKTENRA